MPLPGHTGIQNVTQNCFLSVIVQIFSNLRKLHKEFVYDPMVRGDYAEDGHLGPVTRSFRKLLLSLWSGYFPYVTPMHFKNVFMKECNFGFDFMEQDAHETFIRLNQILHSELRVEASDPNDESKIKCLDGKTSIIYDTFFFEHRVEISCSACTYKNIKMEVNDHLSLPVPDEEHSIQDLVDLNYMSQPLEDYICPDCGNLNTVSSRQKVEKHPPVLVLCLKRVQLKQEDGHYVETKNSTPVSYNLDSIKHAGQDYFLHSVVTHRNMDPDSLAGHYSVFCKNFYNGKWFVYSDIVVQEVEPEKVIDPVYAYMFVYQCREEEEKAQEEYYALSICCGGDEPSEDGATADGEAADGEAADGEAADGEAADGASSNGANSSIEGANSSIEGANSSLDGATSSLSSNEALNGTISSVNESSPNEA